MKTSILNKDMMTISQILFIHSFSYSFMWLTLTECVPDRCTMRRDTEVK